LLIVIAAVSVSALLLALPAQAQYNGHNTLGDFGLMSGTQLDPGFYLAGMYYYYGVDEVLNRKGERVTLAPEDPGEITINALVPLVYYISNFKILGANYGVMAAVPLTNSMLEAPIFGFEQTTGVALSDIYLQPIYLGWHTKQADFTAGFGLFMPTGRYEPDASDNIGLGMWSFEFSAGTTVYLDAKKSWNLATTAFFETHTRKKDSDAKVGDILSLEGGLGKSFLEGALNIGVAYYAQWKLSQDQFGIDLPPAIEERLGKHRRFGIGPDVTFPIATKKKLIALINGRLMWEFGARTTTQGLTLAVTALFPIPSVSIAD
jgi:hypothetical protein